MMRFLLPLWFLLFSAVAEAAPVILVFGDSLSSAYGIPQESGWVALLQQRLRAQGWDYSVVNASISGETTRGGRARIENLLAGHNPAIVVLALGANDGLRGLTIAAMRDNLANIVTSCRRRHARVLLVGMRIPPNYGGGYTREFEAAYREIARQHHIPLVPFLLEPIAAQRELFQPDGLHPTAAAQPRILDTVWSGLKPLLKPSRRN